MTNDDIAAQPRRLYAIGDIHGRLDLLARAVDAIARDVAARGPAALTVTVGDYIDRGPASRGVLDLLRQNPFATPYAALRGNHEEMFEAFLTDPAAGLHWADNGGEETLASYGVRLRGHAPADFVQACEELRSQLPAAHGEFLRALKPSLGHGDYFFCHAGVRPGVPLDRQREEDLLWIRGAFLFSDADFGKIVVHGHTPAMAPEVKANRIGIDTGAYASGRLTCVALGEGEPRFLAV